MRGGVTADNELINYALKAATAPKAAPIQVEDTLIEEDLDLCDPEYFYDMFKDLTFRPEEYTRYKGLDHTALFASSITLSEKYVVIGSNGYDVNKGVVHVYVPKTAVKWSLQALIRSPVWDNSNFGNDVAMDGHRNRMIIAANAFQLYDGAAFIYEQHSPKRWVCTAAIYSPFGGDHPNKTIAQGFGFRVDLYDQFAIISTSVNNAFIYEEVSPGNWTMNSVLVAPAKGIFFGRSVALEGDFAAVGAYGYDESNGRVFLYKRNHTINKFEPFDELVPLRNYSSFGFSLDMKNHSLVVGANGYYKYQFENNAAFDHRNVQRVNNSGWAYVYYLNANGTKWELDEEVVSPVGNNSYFGSGVGIWGDAIVVGADGFPCHSEVGAGFVFHRTHQGWKLNQSYPSPAGHHGHFGYAVAINDQHSVIGAYGFDALRGSVYLAERFRPIVPIPTPFVPTSEPTGPSEVLSGGTLTKKNKQTGLALGVLLALGLGALIAAATAGLIIYCCCCIVPIIPIAKKKKKKEEEPSPFTVHSYAGYVEEEEAENPFYLAPAPVVIIVQAPEEKKKKKEDEDVTYMEDGKLKKLFPYKVYGPRGYVEETGQVLEGEETQDAGAEKEKKLTQKKVSIREMTEIYEAEKTEENTFEYENNMVSMDRRSSQHTSMYQEHQQVPPPQFYAPQPPQRQQLPPYPYPPAHLQGNSFYSQQSDYGYEQHQYSRHSMQRHTSSHYTMDSSLHSNDEYATGLSTMTPDSPFNPNGPPPTSGYLYPPPPPSRHLGQGSLSSLSRDGSLSTGQDVRVIKMITTTTTHHQSTSQHEERGMVMAGDDETVSSKGSLVDAAKAKYHSQYKQHMSQSSLGDSSRQQIKVTKSGSLVEQAKLRYMNLKSSSAMGGEEQLGASRSQRSVEEEGEEDDDDADTVISSQTSRSRTTGSGSLVSQAKQQNQERMARHSSSMSRGDDDSQSVVTESTSASSSAGSKSFVDAAREKYNALKSRQAARGNETTDASSVVSSETSRSSASSLVDQARAKYAQIRSSQAITSSSSEAIQMSSASQVMHSQAGGSENNDIGDSTSVASSHHSFIEKAKAKYAEIQRRASLESGTSSNTNIISETRTEASSTVGGSHVESSYFEQAKERYAAIAKQRFLATATQNVFTSPENTSDDQDGSSEQGSNDSSNGTNFIQQAKAKHAHMMAQRAAALTAQASQTVTHSKEVTTSRTTKMTSSTTYNQQGEVISTQPAQPQSNSSWWSGESPLITKRSSPLAQRPGQQLDYGNDGTERDEGVFQRMQQPFDISRTHTPSFYSQTASSNTSVSGVPTQGGNDDDSFHPAANVTGNMFVDYNLPTLGTPTSSFFSAYESTSASHAPEEREHNKGMGIALQRNQLDTGDESSAMETRRTVSSGSVFGNEPRTMDPASSNMSVSSGDSGKKVSSASKFAQFKAKAEAERKAREAEEQTARDTLARQQQAAAPAPPSYDETDDSDFDPKAQAAERAKTNFAKFRAKAEQEAQQSDSSSSLPMPPSAAPGRLSAIEEARRKLAASKAASKAASATPVTIGTSFTGPTTTVNVTRTSTNTHKSSENVQHSVSTTNERSVKKEATAFTRPVNKDNNM